MTSTTTGSLASRPFGLFARAGLESIDRARDRTRIWQQRASGLGQNRDV
jgi:hypothetical protein